jgi:beta-glucosidase
VIHGFRTIFPVPLGESASFDPVAVENAARIAAKEATASGLHWTYAPMVDIARDPRWGRIVEGSGESAYLGSVLAAARVRGFQGKDLRANDSLTAPPRADATTTWPTFPSARCVMFTCRRSRPPSMRACSR